MRVVITWVQELLVIVAPAMVVVVNLAAKLIPLVVHMDLVVVVKVMDREQAALMASVPTSSVVNVPHFIVQHMTIVRGRVCVVQRQKQVGVVIVLGMHTQTVLATGRKIVLINRVISSFHVVMLMKVGTNNALMDYRDGMVVLGHTPMRLLIGKVVLV